MSVPAWIDSPGALTPIVSRVDPDLRLGVDAEGDGLYRYRSRLCMMQICGGELEALIDTLALDDLTPLQPLLGEDGPLKVLHDVSFDAKMLDQRGLSLGRVFDTAVAARFLGEKSTGLAALLEKYFEVQLDKKHQQADWGERPLDEDQKRYLVEDVRYLPELAKLFEARAAELDVLEEIDEETRYAMRRALEPEVEREPWTRIKGARDLSGHALAVLVALANVREREAAQQDVPPFRVTGNRVLFEAARRRPRTLAQLRKIRGLRQLDDAQLLDALEAAERDGVPQEDATPPPPAEERAQRKAREKALTEWRKKEAAERGVNVQVVLPGHCLRDVAKIEQLEDEALASVDGFGKKRLARYGSTLLDVLRAADAA